MVNPKPLVLELLIMARTSTVVDRSKFEQAVKNAEANGPLKNLGMLHNAVVKHYTILTIDDNGLKPISAAIVRDRLTEWQIHVLTTPGRTEKPDLFGRRINAIVTGINFVIENMPAELTEVTFLLEELKRMALEPLEPVVVADNPVESAEDEEIVDPNAVDVPSAEMAAELFDLSEVSDHKLAA